MCNHCDDPVECYFRRRIENEGELRWLQDQAVDVDVGQEQTREMAYDFSFSSVE